VALSLSAFACSPPRQSFTMDVQDVAADLGSDLGADFRDESDGEAGDAGCNTDTCNANCMSMGYSSGGACRATDMSCQCFGSRDAGMPDGVATDGPSDAGILTCTTNDECPPTTFRNGQGCGTPGCCYPRGESDAATCGTDGPPACGCDGIWYANTCSRLATGVRLNPISAAFGAMPMSDAGGGG